MYCFWTSVSSAISVISVQTEYTESLTICQPQAHLAATYAFFGIVSNSWGAQEHSGEQNNDSDFALPGVVYIASVGDTTGIIDYPAASPNLIAAGGTEINRNGSGDFTSESFWSSDGGDGGNGGSGGISAYESRPSYQSGIASRVDPLYFTYPSFSVIVESTGCAE